MKLTDCEYEKLLPRFMRDEPDVVALCRTLDPEIRKIGEAIPMASIWEHIDELPEEYLDELAKDLDVTWYHTTASIESKREMIKNADKVHQKLGTRWAIEFVLSMYFQAGEVQEWFDYNGIRGHFKVIVKDQDFKPDVSEELYSLLSEVKRAGAVMDTVEHIWENSLRYSVSPVGYTRTEVHAPIRMIIPPEKNYLTTKIGLSTSRAESLPPIMIQ